MGDLKSLDKNLWLIRIFKERRHIAPSMLSSFMTWFKDRFNAR